jgi:hypothetical protein
VKENKPIALIRACTENTGVLVSLRQWLNDERDAALRQLGDARELPDIYRLQGEARCIRRLREAITNMTKEKGQVDA